MLERLKRFATFVGLTGAVAATIVVAYRAGYQASENAAKAAVHTARANAAVVSQAVEAKVSGAIARTEANRRVIHDLVPVYVPAAADRQCVVGVGAVELLDAAAEDRPPVAPAEPPEAPSGVALSEVVGTEADNLGLCNEWRTQVNGWIDWYAGTRAALGLPPVLSDSPNSVTPSGER